MYDRELFALKSLLDQWTQTGCVDIQDYRANEVMLLLSGDPVFREKFVTLLKDRLAETMH
jgi:hypothetical protein